MPEGRREPGGLGEPGSDDPGLDEFGPGRRAPNFDPPGPAEPEDPALARKRRLMSRIRLGLGFAFAVSLMFHTTLLALFVGGTAPGLPDGQEGIAVDVITQEQYDLMVGEGSSPGGKARKVEDAGQGEQREAQVPAPATPRKVETTAQQREAPPVIASTLAPDLLPEAKSERLNSAATPTPPQARDKSDAQGNQREAKAARRTDPKETGEDVREEARNPREKVERRPGAEGGETQRVASRGGVGEANGPLPPSMRQALMQQLQKQIEVCYVPPREGTAGELPLVLIRFHRDGSLDGQPRSLRYERTPGGRALVKAALKAVRQCSPYRMPPRFAAYYEDWREIRAEFEFGGR